PRRPAAAPSSRHANGGASMSRANSCPCPTRRRRGDMPAITLDPLRPEALAGLKEPRGLLTTLNRLQTETGAVLNAGATLANAWNAVFTGVELVTPDDWEALTPLN